MSSAEDSAAATCPAAPGSQPPEKDGLTVARVLALQHGSGNRATARLVGAAAGPPAPQRRTRPPALSSASLGRALARCAAARVDRCPDGSCEGECDEHEPRVPEQAYRGRPIAKALGGNPVVPSAASPAPPLTEIDPSAGTPDAPADAGDMASPVATDPSSVDVEVADESTDDGLEDADVVPQADETPEPAPPVGHATRLARKATGSVNLGSAEPSHELDVAAAEPALAKCGVKTSASMKRAAYPSIGLDPGVYGLTYPESVNAKITACRSGKHWVPGVLTLTGRYSMQVRLLPGQREVTGPKGNTTKANFCDQVRSLHSLGTHADDQWYMLRAVKKHEQVHKAHFVPALKAAKPAIVKSIGAVRVPHHKGMDSGKAADSIIGTDSYKHAIANAQDLWLTEVLTRAAPDHAAGGAAEQAEHKVVDPMVEAICKTAKAKKWTGCSTCGRLTGHPH